MKVCLVEAGLRSYESTMRKISTGWWKITFPIIFLHRLICLRRAFSKKEFDENQIHVTGNTTADQYIRILRLPGDLANEGEVRYGDKGYHGAKTKGYDAPMKRAEDFRLAFLMDSETKESAAGDLLWKDVMVS